MPSLTDLFPEILEEIVLKLKLVEDVINLGSSCTHLARIVGHERIWKVILSKNELVEGGRVREDRVRVITTFLSSLVNSNSLLSLLHRMIYERYPSTVQGWEEAITVRFPSSPHLHLLSSLGLELLALTDREDARHMLHKVRVSEISPSLLLSLTSLKREQMTELVVGDVCCTTEEEGKAMVHHLDGDLAGPDWRGGRADMGNSTAQSPLLKSTAMAPVGRGWAGSWRRWAGWGESGLGGRLVGRGRREDLMAVWENTEVSWSLDGEKIWRRPGGNRGDAIQLQ